MTPRSANGVTSVTMELDTMEKPDTMDPDPTQYDPSITEATWPEAIPPKGTEFAISVSCGNTHYNFATHDLVNGHVSLFYRTSMFSEEDMQMSPCLALRRYTPRCVQEKIFGIKEEPADNSPISKFTRETAIKHLASKRIPFIPIYIVSSNPKHEKGIEYMFSDIPVKLYRLGSTDFFLGAYPGMGIDRLAACRAAVDITGVPALVIDGGTALAYTEVNADGNIGGGGISPGFSMKFSVLAEQTGALPAIRPMEFHAEIEKRMEDQAPFSGFPFNTREAMMTAVLNETAQHLVSVIQLWYDKHLAVLPMTDKSVVSDDEETPVRHKKNKEMTVLVAGGDSKILKALLSENHGNLIPMTCHSLPPVKIQLQKHLIPFAIQGLLDQRSAEHVPSDTDKKRLFMVGQRVATFFHDGVFRGTVMSVYAGDEMEEDLYMVVYDDKDLDKQDVKGLYDSLTLYVLIGEAWQATTSEQGDSMKIKRSSAEEAAEILFEIPMVQRQVRRKSLASTKSRAVSRDKTPPSSRKRVRRNLTESVSVLVGSGSVSGSVHGAVGSSGNVIPTGSKDSNDVWKEEDVDGGNDATVDMEPFDLDGDPNGVVGRRIAKMFDGQMYCGTIAAYYSASQNKDGEESWVGKYDDGDAEDYAQEPLKECLKLYHLNRDHDPEPRA